MSCATSCDRPSPRGPTPAFGWTNSGGGAITFLFDSGINAFGVDLYSLGTSGFTILELTTTTGSEVVFRGTADPAEVFFAGVIDPSQSFLAATFINTSPLDYVEFDKVRFGVVPASVPEPSSLVLLGLCGTGFGAVRLRRRSGG